MSLMPVGFLRLCLVTFAVSLLFAGQGLGFIIDPSATPWLTTASGSRSANGQPATLTWGFVPDGTTVLDGFTSLGGSDLIANLNTTFNGNPAQTDLSQQPWFNFFADSFGRWSQLSGLTYAYEPNDSGGSISAGAGVLGVRADVRISGASVDGSSGTLAFNYFPDDGDMTLDTDDMAFFANASGSHVRLRNTITHEAGHGLGYEHVESNTDALLMEPFISTAFDGPQLDEVRAAHFYYGDVHEKSNAGLGNGTAGRATTLGTILDNGSASIGVDADIPSQAISPSDTDFVSVSNNNDVDFFSFTVTEPSTVDLQLKPLGGLFNQASQGFTPTPFDASARADLSLRIWDTDGLTVLATADALPAGGIESLLGIALPAAGEYFASITTITDTVQLYRLDVSVESAVPIVGDLDNDGFVGIEDLNLILGNWNANVTPGDLLAGDPSGDGFIGIEDLNVVLGNWNAGTPPPTGTIVPEPSTLAMLGLGAMGALNRKRYGVRRRRQVVR